MTAGNTPADTSAVIRRFPVEHRHPATIEQLRKVIFDRALVSRWLQAAGYGAPGTAAVVARQGRAKARALLRHHDSDEPIEQVTAALTEWLRRPIERVIAETAEVRDRLWVLQQEHRAFLAMAKMPDNKTYHAWMARRSAVSVDAAAAWTESQMLLGAWDVVQEVMAAYVKGIRPRRHRQRRIEAAAARAEAIAPASNIVPFSCASRLVFRRLGPDETRS